MSDATTPVILAACRTPIGKYLGGLGSLTAPALGALVIKEAVTRAKIDPTAIDEVIMGHVLQGGTGQAPARQAMIHAGLDGVIPALTINKVCGSSLKAVMLAAQSIKAGDNQLVMAGGMESMSNAAHYLHGIRGGVKIGNQTMLDGMIHDGLWDSFTNQHMGNLAEYTASKAGISRVEQDEFSYQSQRKAADATAKGRFAKEIVPVEIASRAGKTTVSQDEGPRADTTLEGLAKLRAAFVKDGTVTAGNASTLNDGASAVVVASLAFAKAHGLTPLARISGYATGGGDPKDLFFAPIFAVQNLMKKAGTAIGDYGLIEANEAFASQCLADAKGLGWDPSRVNVNGGAIALGHPIGASGARVLTTLLYAMADHKVATGLATLCLGGGNAVALSVEAV